MSEKRLFAFILFFTFWFYLNLGEIKAQDFGLKSGLVFSTINGQESSSIKPGLQLGAYKKFGATEKLFMQMEALLTQKGSWNWDSQNEKNINLYYFDLALMFGVLAGDKFTFNFGIQPSVFLGGNFKHTEDGSEQNQRLMGEVSALDYSTLFGWEYDVNDYFTLGGRFNYSFVPLQSYDNIFAENNELPYSMVFQLYGKIRFEKMMDMIKGEE